MTTNWIKASFYLGFIAYHVTDLYFDWRGYNALENSEAFAVVPKGNLIARNFYFASCIVGTITALAMLIVYGGYVAYHAYSTNEGDLSPIVAVETYIAVFELLLKDDIQSILVWLIYHSDPRVKCVSYLTKAFTVCSIVAHTKLFLCFSSSFFRDKNAGKWGCVVRIFGCIGSLIFLIFTALKFSEIRNWLPYEGDADINCTQYVEGL